MGAGGSSLNDESAEQATRCKLCQRRICRVGALSRNRRLVDSQLTETHTKNDETDVLANPLPNRFFRAIALVSGCQPRCEL